MDSKCDAGFTLIELIVTLIIIGILASTVVPRFFGTHGFEERGFNDETANALRYAQKSAIAHRRTVCVNFAQQSVVLTIASINGGVCDIALASPDSAAQYKIDAATNAQYRNTTVKFASIPNTLTFNALGQPSAGATIQVDNYPNAITVEPITGYVH